MTYTSQSPAFRRMEPGLRSLRIARRMEPFSSLLVGAPAYHFATLLNCLRCECISLYQAQGGLLARVSRSTEPERLKQGFGVYDSYGWTVVKNSFKIFLGWLPAMLSLLLFVAATTRTLLFSIVLLS